MQDLTAGHNVSDFYLSRPKPNPWIYLVLVLVFFITWAYREGAAEPSGFSELLFILSMVGIALFVLLNLSRARAARSVAEKRYQAFLAEHSKAQLQLLLKNPTLSQQSTVLVVQYLRQHFPANE